jgi:WD40 repeat protein
MVHTTTLHKDNNCGLRSLEYNFDDSYFMVGGTDGNAYLYDAESFQPVVTYKKDRMKSENTGKITCIKAHPDHSNLFVVSNNKNTVLLYDTRTGGAYKSFAGPNIIGQSIDVHEDIIVTGSNRNNKEVELFSFSK